MAWIEGFTSSTEVLKTIAANACTLHKDAAGKLIQGKNWEMVYPSPLTYRTVRRVIQEVLSSNNYQMYNTAHRPIAPHLSVRVFREGSLVSPAEYNVNYQAGSIVFNSIQRHIEKAVDETAVPDSNYRNYMLPHTEIVKASLVVYRDGTQVDPIEYSFNALTGVISFRFPQSGSTVITASYDYLGNPYEILVDYTYFTDLNSVTGEVLATSDGIVFSTQNGNLSESPVAVYSNMSYVSPSEYTVDRQNGRILFHTLQSNVSSVAGESLSSTDYHTFTVTNKPMTFIDPVVVYREGMQVQPTEYTIDRVNGSIAFNSVQRRTIQITQGLTSTTDYKIYTVAYMPIMPGTVVVYRNAQPVSASEYVVNLTLGTITFQTTQAPTDVITADYIYYGAAFDITVDYSYFNNLVALSNVVLTTTNYLVYATGHNNVLPSNLVVTRNGVEVDPSEYTLNIQNGTISFQTIQSPSDVIRASFIFCPRINYITADYSYYASLTEVLGEEVVPVNNQVFYTGNHPVSSEHTLVVYKDNIALDDNEFSINYQTGAVVFDTPVDPLAQITADYSYFTDGIEEAISAISDRLVMKTTTTPVALTPEQQVQNLYSDHRLNMTSLTMFVEFRRPARPINPETGTEFYRNVQGFYVRVPGANHYYLDVRMFDKWDDVQARPVAPVYDSYGLVVNSGAAVSPWSKLSWFRDWKEVPLVYATETLADDKQIAQGPFFQPIETSAYLTEIPIRYWMSINNDRIIMVLMGEPSVDVHNYIIGFMYAGRIKPNEGGINDTFGNFALTTTSSTVPCKITKPPTDRPVITSIAGATSGGQLRTSNAYYYVVTYTTHGGESAPSNYRHVVFSGSYNNNAVTLNIQLPDEAQGWKVYRYAGGSTSTSLHYPNDLSRYRLLAIITDTETTTFVDDGSVTPANESPAPNGRSVTGVVRDSKTGAVIAINYPDNYGSGTATGVTDISMYRTRGGAFYQQHRVAFHTTEELMTKIGFNPSSFTGKIYVSCISVVHPFDGYRGVLDDVLAVDSTSLAPLDELIINKGTDNEEVYKFFAVNAPYSFITASPNSFSGLAVKKG